jgi:Domain of unknown function (DUF3854)
VGFAVSGMADDAGREGAAMSTPTLMAHHRQMLTESSGIAPEVIAERGYRSLEGVDGYSELKTLGFSKAQAQTPGLLLPLHTTDGQQAFMIYRPDTPRFTKDGKSIKYEIPKGGSIRLDCPPRCQPQLANPSTPLYMTEGQKKADAIASQGAVTLCLLGVWAFVGKNTFGGNTLLADFDHVAWNGREVRLCFDSDVVDKPSVRTALERLTAHLINKKATVRAVYLPPLGGKKVGVDDFLAAGHTIQDLEALIDAPRPQPQPAPVQVKILDTAPARISRPLALIDGRTYGAIWPHTEVTRIEVVNKEGKVVRLNPPEVTTEQRLFIVRDDGVVFGEEGGNQTFARLGMTIDLAEIPQSTKLWAAPSVKAYVEGARPDPVAVFAQIKAVVDRFIDFNRSLGDQDTMCALVACYILGTWFLDAFTVIGYLWPNGEKGSGKTQLLTLVAELGYLGQLILAGSSYACLRDFADYGAVLCFDDAEHVMDLKKGDPDKRALLLAGNRRGNTIAVKEPGAGNTWRTRYVQTFCPRLFSAIRLPDPVLASRTIIVPLIRTANREKANADPLDARLWPTPRQELVNSLWALALHRMADLPRYDAQVADNATLLGRNLEPWRAILAVARWLTDCGATELYGRMDALSHAYQTERPDLEPQDLTAWVIRALCHYATNATSATMQVGLLQVEGWEFPTKEIKQSLVILLQDEETGIDISTISTDRIGRLLGKLRLKKKPRKVASDPRQWQLSKQELRHWLVSYGMSLPDTIFPQQSSPSPSGTSGTTSSSSSSSSPSTTSPQTSGTSGTNGHFSSNATSDSPLTLSGASGIVAQPGSVNGATQEETCPQCGETQRPNVEILGDGSTIFRCSQCSAVLDRTPF